MERCIIVDYGFLQLHPSHSPIRQFQKGPIQAAVTSVSAKRSYRALALDFENARKTLWVKQQLCAAELTTKGSLYEV